MGAKKILQPKQQIALLQLLETRFEKNMHRHRNIKWKDIMLQLEANPEKLWSLQEMEQTGGEPDIIGFDKKNGVYIFYDCAAESPIKRRSICFDRAGLDSRKEFKPVSSAMEMAESMGIELLTETEYRQLQELGEFDTKTSSWLQTPPSIRSLGGALFGDRRFNKVFVYHNGAQSYYGGRGFRGSLCV